MTSLTTGSLVDIGEIFNGILPMFNVQSGCRNFFIIYLMKRVRHLCDQVDWKLKPGKHRAIWLDRAWYLLKEGCCALKGWIVETRLAQAAFKSIRPTLFENETMLNKNSTKILIDVHWRRVLLKSKTWSEQKRQPINIILKKDKKLSTKIKIIHSLYVAVVCQRVKQKENLNILLGSTRKGFLSMGDYLMVM